MINAEFRDIISEYFSTGSCRAIKILLDPFDYLNGLIQYIKTSSDFNILDFPENTCELSYHVDTIIHMFIQGYVNYFNDEKLPVLYRNMSESELNKIKYDLPIYNFLSTSKDYNETLNFVSDKFYFDIEAEREYIIKFNAETTVPHINALEDSTPMFERNEIILLPNVHINLGKEIVQNNADLAKNGIMSMYEAKISYQGLKDQYDYELLTKYYDEITDSFLIYASKIITAMKDLRPLYNPDYMEWSETVQKYFKLLEGIIYTELKNGMYPENLCRKLQKYI